MPTTLVTDAALPTSERERIVRKLLGLFDDALAHNGFADVRVSMRPLRRGRKEVVLAAGKEWRYVIDVPLSAADPHTHPEADRRSPCPSVFPLSNAAASHGSSRVR